jgi:hypothetical protein
MRASHPHSELLVTTAGELIQVAGEAASNAIDSTLHAEELTVPDHGDEPLPRLHPTPPLINTTPTPKHDRFCAEPDVISPNAVLMALLQLTRSCRPPKASPSSL